MQCGAHPVSIEQWHEQEQKDLETREAAIREMLGIKPPAPPEEDW